MTAHLLALAVGPVQEFIAAARRTRDLWLGSTLLSEVSKAAALAVFDAGGKLIFPAPEKREDLEPGSPLNVANIIVAELTDRLPADIARTAMGAAERCWLDYAGKVQQELKNIIRPILWEEQVKDVIEFYAAWVPLGANNYAAQRQRLMRLLAGRKNCRDFQAAKGHEAIPKSSLDGLRESVLLPPEEWPKDRRRRQLRIRTGEQLDVVGLVKRVAEGHRPYPSVSRVAADPWLRGITVDPDSPLADLIAICQGLEDEKRIHRLKGHPQYKAFPFEGSVLYRTRHHELVEETEDRRPEPGQRPQWLVDLSNTLTAVEQFAKASRFGKQPDPYLAVLVADGDRVGKAISALKTADQHRTFSQGLSRFAGMAHEIVQEHHGVLVYSGGDDVLAFVPVDQCLPCARRLHDEFGRLMGELLKDLNITLDPPVTLSVGLAIAHFLENLEDLLGYGRAAEKAAKKPDRDGLAVHLHKRGGAPVMIRSQWDDGPDRRLRELAELLRIGAIPGKVGHDLEEVARVYKGWPAATVKEAIRRDALRVVARKRPRGASRMDRVRILVQERVDDSESLGELANELLITRQIAIAHRQSGTSAFKPEENR